MASVPNPGRNGPTTPRTRTARANPPPPASADPIQAIFDALAAPFEDHELRTRDGGFGKVLVYITAGTARKRLNSVLGPDSWECEVTPTPDSVVCRIIIHLPDGRSLTRAAMGGYPDMPSAEDRVKGGDSDAFKRSCVLFGIGAYLYETDDQAAPPPAAAPERSLESVRTGRQLFAWGRDRGMLDEIVAAGRALRLPPRIVDWSPDEVDAALGHITEGC
jgi:hypothetical protein